MHDDNVDVHVQAVEKFVAITQTTPSFARGFLEGFSCSLSKVFFLANETASLAVHFTLSRKPD